MANDLNRCEFIGRLGREIDIRAMKNGEQMVTFSIAVNESYIDKTGQSIKKAEWVNVIAYRKLAEICIKFLGKGSHVYIAGKFQTHKFMGKDGIEKSATQIVLETLQVLNNKMPSHNQEINGNVAPVSDDIFDDDIPF